MSVPAALIPSEHQDQCAVVAWFQVQFPKVRILSIPNGAHLAGSEKQRAIQVQRLLKEGLSPGAPDLYVPAWRLWIEMKRAKNGRVSAEQQSWLEYLTGIGDRVILARGFEEARAGIMEIARS